MKKVLTLILIIFMGGYVQAQSTRGFRLGLTANPTFGYTKVTNNTGKNDGISLGFIYGLLGDFNFEKNYSFSTALTIVTINGKTTQQNISPFYNAGSGNVDYAVKYKMQYIEIPLTIKLKTNVLNPGKLYGQLGLSNDFAISRRYDIKQGSQTIADNEKSSKYTNFYRAGLIIGAGYEFDLDEKTTVALGFTLNNGFTKMSSNTPSDGGVRNHFFALNLGVFF